MIFFFRAAFWTLVVSAFIPAGFYAPQDGAFARQAGEIAAHTLDDASAQQMNTAAICQGREALCETVGEFARFSGWAASMAADQAEAAFEDYTVARAEPGPSSRSADEVFAAAAGEPVAR
jgi:hypothetical protein